MAAVSVSFDGTRVHDADTTTNWTGATQEIEFVYQGTYSNSVQVKTTENGTYYFNTATAANYSTTPSKVWLAKTWITNYGALDGNGLVLEIGTGARTAYYRYFVYSAATYPISGGWLLTPIDPSLSGYYDATVGTPTLSNINFYGIRADFSVQSRTGNVAMDAIDYFSSGTGLTLIGGDGADPDGTFTSFVTYDEGTNTNRYGIVSTKEGILYVLGTLTIGSATATVFTDTNQTLVFPNGNFGTGTVGIKVNLASATTAVSMSTITMVGRGLYGNDGSTADTRPDFTVTNTSGTFVMDACNLINFRTITLNSASTITDTSFNRCLSIIPDQGTLDNCVIEASPVASGTATVTAADITDITNCSFISGGTGHAILISSTSGSPFTFVGNTFSGYGGTPGSNLTASSGSTDAAIYNNSGGAITINITSGGSTPSVRNGAGATTTVNSNVTLTITVQDEGANPINGAQVSAYKTSDNSTIVSPTTTNASGIVTGSAAASTGAIYIRVRQSNTADSPRYYPTSTVGTVGTDDFSVTITMIEDTTVT
jgi:hypothetical protein